VSVVSSNEQSNPSISTNTVKGGEAGLPNRRSSSKQNAFNGIRVTNNPTDKSGWGQERGKTKTDNAKKVRPQVEGTFPYPATTTPTKTPEPESIVDGRSSSETVEWSSGLLVLFRLSVGVDALFRGFVRVALVLEVFVVDTESLLNFSAQGVVVRKAEEKLV